MTTPQCSQANFRLPSSWQAGQPAPISCYYLMYYPTAVTWATARQGCRNAGGTMAAIRNSNEANDVIYSYCGGQGNANTAIWLGYYVPSAYPGTYGACQVSALGQSNPCFNRLNWRWENGADASFMHANPQYWLGSDSYGWREPDDFGCAALNGGDEKQSLLLGDLACEDDPQYPGYSRSNWACCEAPVIPSQSPTATATRTPSNTITRSSTGTNTATATNTLTGTATQTVTGTGTQTSTQTATSTSTRTGTKSVTPTMSVTPSPSPSTSVTASVSPSSSVSPSTSVSPSSSVTASSSVSVSVSVTVSPSATVSITLTPKAIKLGNLDGGVGGDAIGYNGSAILALNEPEKDNGGVVAIAAGAGGAGLIALLLMLCCLWWCLLVIPRRKRKEEAARKKLANRKSFAAKASALSKSKKHNFSTTLLDTGNSSANPKGASAGKSTNAALFSLANPALLKVKRGSTAPALPATAAEAGKRAPRMTMALSAYKRPVAAFSPTRADGASHESPNRRASRASHALQQSDYNDDAPLYDVENGDGGVIDDGAIGLADDDDNDDGYNNGGNAWDDQGNHDYNYGYPQQQEEEYPQQEAEEEEPTAEDDADDDAADDEEDIAGVAGRKVAGKKATGGGWLSNKAKKTQEHAVAPPVEDKKLVIGKGAVLKERVEKQVVTLRRVSKVRGDATLTALRQESAQRFMRPSGVATAVGAAAAAGRPISVRETAGVITPYAFTATVSRTVEKHRRSTVAKPSVVAFVEESGDGDEATGVAGGDEEGYGYYGNGEQQEGYYGDGTTEEYGGGDDGSQQRY